MKLTRWIWTVAVAVAVVGCSTMRATTDYDHSANFKEYRTFKMLDGKALPSNNGVPANTLVKDRIRDDIKSQLVSKGLTPTDSKPDLLVGYVAGAQRREDLQAVGPYDPALGPYPGYWGPNDVWATEYQHGTLVIDLVDNDTKKMVWRSTVEADKNQLSELGDPSTIQEAVGKAFKQFPPETKEK